jgi:hypothetical protein
MLKYAGIFNMISNTTLQTERYIWFPFELNSMRWHQRPQFNAVASTSQRHYQSTKNVEDLFGCFERKSQYFILRRPIRASECTVMNRIRVKRLVYVPGTVLGLPSEPIDIISSEHPDKSSYPHPNTHIQPNTS